MTGFAAGQDAVSVAAMGSFTVAGRSVEVSGRPEQRTSLSAGLSGYLVDPNGTYYVGQAYVQYFIPAAARGVPVVLVHGGGLTGSCWETTPDGRAGWAWHFLRNGHPVYVVDNVERGRAGWSPLVGPTSAEPPVIRSAEEAWTVFRIGPADGYADRKPFAGNLFPADHLGEMCRQFVPRWMTTTDLAITAIEALLKRIGPCAVIAHSQGGGIAAHAAVRQADKVLALVLLEPHGMPDLTSLPVRPGAADPRAVPQLVVGGDFIDISPLYVRLRDGWHAYRQGVTAAGGRADYLDLPAAGHPGNSHMIMMDRNSDLVASLVAGWLGQVAGQSA